MHARMQRVRDTWSQLAPAQVLLSATVCLAVAWAAQRNLDQHSTKPLVFGAFAAASLAFAVLTHRVRIEPSPPTGKKSAPLAPALPVLAVSLGLSLLGCLDFGGNQFRPLGLVLWLGGLSTAVLYLWLITPRQTDRPQVAGVRTGAFLIPWHWLALLAILLVGVWVRVRLLSEIPADMGWDLPYNYYDAQAILAGKLSIFFPANLGREGMFFYLIALCARVLGLSQWTLQFTSALVGTLTIVAMYALGREAFNRQVGLLAALLLAINRWHIVLSRSGYRVILMPLFCILVLYTLMRALRTRQLLDWAWAGIALGGGLYTYKSFLFVPVVMGVALILYLLIRGRSELHAILPGLFLLGLFGLAVIAPMGRYILERPKEYFAREQRQLEVMGKEKPPAYLVYYWRSLQGYNAFGDGNPRFNVNGARHMGFVSGVLLVLGFGYALWHWRSGYNMFLLAGVLGLVLPTTFAMLPGEPANIFRMSGVIGPAIALAAVPLCAVLNRLAAGQTPAGAAVGASPANAAEDGYQVSLMVNSPARRLAWRGVLNGTSVATIVVLLAGAWLLARENAETNRFYFHDYVAVLPDRANYSMAREVAREISHFDNLQATYIKAWPYWFDGNALRTTLQLPQFSLNPDVLTLDPNQPPLSDVQGLVLFLVHPEDEAALQTLRSFFPHGVALPRYSPDGRLAFYAFYGER